MKESSQKDLAVLVPAFTLTPKEMNDFRNHLAERSRPAMIASDQRRAYDMARAATIPVCNNPLGDKPYKSGDAYVR